MLTIIITLVSCSATACGCHPTLRAYVISGGKVVGRVILRGGYEFAKVRYPVLMRPVTEEERYTAWLKAHAPQDGPTSGAQC